MDSDELLTLHRSIFKPSGYPEIPSTARLLLWRRQITSNAWTRRLDRVNVLGNNGCGHTGCVNALSWSQNGELLISSGDDRRLRVWRMDHSSDIRDEYPFTCQTVIDTGHCANVFNAQMLPSSTRIATVAGDKQVRVFDIGESVGRSPSGNEMNYSTEHACICILRCHSKRTKRIVAEESPDLFLTVAEDGEVRQHDLRAPHSCGRGSCPTPLVKLPHELSTIAHSPLTPYQFVVGGESPFAHLFDRRHAGRHLQEEWGMPLAISDVTTCVRRFSRRSRAPGETRGCEHITGARMSTWNGHELLLSFHSDAVYMYSTRDEPNSDPVSHIVPPNVASFPLRGPNIDRKGGHWMLQDHAQDEEEDAEVLDDDEYDDDVQSAGEVESDDDGRTAPDIHSGTPVIYPQRRFSGHCNVDTVKDVNFLGPRDEYVTSGSDDGNFFVWKKTSGELVDVLEGDDSVVNVIEGHPALPLVAVSGIDTTIKLFAPARGPATYSRYEDVGSITRRNARASRRGLNRSVNLQLVRLVMQHQDRASEMLSGESTNPEDRLAHCTNQ